MVVALSSPWILRKWRECCDAPDSSCDVASGARGVDALVYYDVDVAPLQGYAILLSSHFILAASCGGRPLLWVPFHAVTGMCCTERVLFPGKSFDCPTNESGCLVALEDVPETVARRVITVELFADGAAIYVKLTGLDGEQFARAMLLLWHISHNGTWPGNDNEKIDCASAFSRCPVWHLGDALYAIAGAPVCLPAIILHHAGGMESSTAVELFMLNESEVCVTRKPRTAAVFWRAIRADANEMELLAMDDMVLIAFPSSTTLRLVGRQGEVWAFEVSDADADSTVRHSLRRLAALCLLGILRRRGTNAVCGLRHVDIASLHQQYCTIDGESVGYVLRTALEAAIGPLLACDVRLMTSIGWCCSDREDSDGDGAMAGGRVRLASYVDGMRVLLQGTAMERAAVAFRAFGGRGNNQSIDETKGEVRWVDFKCIANDIRCGLRLAPITDDAKESGASMSFDTFIEQFNVLTCDVDTAVTAAAVSSFAAAWTLPPSLGFGSVHWIQLTYLMTGIESALSAQQQHQQKTTTTQFDRSSYEAKTTFDLSGSSPTIAGGRNAPQLGAVNVASNFLRKRIPSLQGDRITFADYAPAIFAATRCRFGVDHSAFLDALGISALRARLLLGRLCAPRDLRSSGRSGSLLLCSHDCRFILKRVFLNESRTMRRTLPAYFMHAHRYAHTLLPRYAGLYALTRGNEKSAFVIAENVFVCARLPVMSVYDLKGSTVHRSTEPAARRDGAAGKDNDFIAEKRRLRLAAGVRDAFLAQLDADTAFLEACNVLDYSLMVGIHDSFDVDSREAKELRLAQQQKMRVVRDELGCNEKEDSDNKNSKNGHTLIDEKFENCQESVFRAYYGGLASADGSEVYYFGFVDCLTVYGLKKVGEHYGKSMLLHDMKEVSCVPPPVYRARFMEFMRSIIEETETK